MTRKPLPVILVFLSLAISAAVAMDGYYRFPTVMGDTVVFSAEGDLYAVELGGTPPLQARRLTTHPALERSPALSPDGKTVAFTASYEGPAEVYTMPVTGGLPQRRTWHGGYCEVVGWKSGGVLVYASQKYTTLPGWNLLTLDLATGAETRVPLFDAADGAWDDTGTTLYFTRFRKQPSHTKRYKGGTAQSLWKYSDGDAEAVPLSAGFEGTDQRPMWWDGRVYFRSDRDGTMNLWSMDRDGGDLKQHTHHQGFDVLGPSLGDGRVVYQLGADLWVYDIASNATKKLRIDLPSDFDQMRERWIQKPVDWLTSARLSDDGTDLVLTARGQVFVTPVDGGRMVEVTRRNGVRYRQARLLPDGKTVLTLSDEGGEVEWWTFRADGFGEGKKVTDGGTILRFDGRVSPDGKRVVSWNQDQEIWLHDLSTGKGIKVDYSPQWGFDNPSWSPDSRWIAYGKPASNGLMRIFLYQVETGKKIALTTDRYDNFSTVFTPDGKAVYLLSNRNIRSIVPSPWGSKQQEPFFDKQARIFRIPLAEADRSPFQPDDELHKAKSKDQEDRNGKNAKEKKTGKKGKKGKKGADDQSDGKEKPIVVTVNETGLQARIQDVPVPAGNYSALAVSKDRLFWIRSESDGSGRDLMAMKIDNDDPKPEVIVSGVRSYQLSRDGKKLLVRKGDTFHVIAASAGKKADLAKGKVDLSGWMFPIDPREEWLQMFVESWRLERDYFYDKGMHGVNWLAMLHKYLPLVDRLRSREDLADLQGQMAGELSTLHTFVRPGDTREGDEDIRPGSLGARLVRDEAAGGYRVEHIYLTDPDVPSERSPLLRPGVNVQEGEVISRVNGEPVLSAPSIETLLRNQAGKQVRLTIGDRDVVVKPVSLRSEREMEYDEWEFTRRLEVEKKGEGAIGYVHLRAMGAGNMAEWYREFYPVIDRKGLVIDARHNRGGNIDSWILSRLIREVWMYWKPRVGGGSSWENMQRTFRGHLVLLVDAHTASDGEAFAAGFRRLGLGKVIGTRTWGGEIWLSSSNRLVDNGIMTAAEFGVYGPEGKWLIEGHGVDPDIVVDNLPHDTFNGGDAQLDAAIDHLKKLIAADPRDVPPAPPYPDKSFEN